MDFAQALTSLVDGKKVKLPEWQGYWFIPNVVASWDAEEVKKGVRVFTATGDVLNTPWFDKYHDRDDFEITEGKMGIGFAVAALETGKKVYREGWNGKGMWLHLRVPDENSEMGHPYPYMKGVDGNFFPWNPNALDLLAKDWQIAE